MNLLRLDLEQQCGYTTFKRCLSPKQIFFLLFLLHQKLLLCCLQYLTSSHAQQDCSQKITLYLFTICSMAIPGEDEVTR